MNTKELPPNHQRMKWTEARVGRPRRSVLSFALNQHANRNKT